MKKRLKFTKIEETLRNLRLYFKKWLSFKLLTSKLGLVL